MTIRKPKQVPVTTDEGRVELAKVDEVKVIEGHVWVKLEKRVTGFVGSKVNK